MSICIDTKQQFDEFLDRIVKILEIIENSSLPESQKSLLYTVFEKGAYWAIQLRTNGNIISPSLDILLDGIKSQHAQLLSRFGIRLSKFQDSDVAKINFPTTLLELNPHELQFALEALVPSNSKDESSTLSK